MSKQTPNAGGNRRPTKPLLEPLRVAALGDYHPPDRCSWCGLLSSETELHIAVLVATRAEAVVCTDGLACLRRVKGVA
jgi:hypothetical protein